MKPAREPASSRPKPCASLKNASRILPVRHSLLALVGRKQTVVIDQSFSLRNFPVRAFDSRAQGFSFLLARQRSSCPPPSPNLVRAHPMERYQALRDSAPCLSRATTSRRAPNWSSEEARTSWGTSIFGSSTNHAAAASLLAASPEGELGTTPAGKTPILIPQNPVSEGEGTTIYRRTIG